MALKRSGRLRVHRTARMPAQAARSQNAASAVTLMLQPGLLTAADMQRAGCAAIAAALDPVGYPRNSLKSYVQQHA